MIGASWIGSADSRVVIWSILGFRLARRSYRIVTMTYAAARFGRNHA